jgi:hypothetical protein
MAPSPFSCGEQVVLHTPRKLCIHMKAAGKGGCLNKSRIEVAFPASYLDYSLSESAYVSNRVIR